MHGLLCKMRVFTEKSNLISKRCKLYIADFIFRIDYGSNEKSFVHIYGTHEKSVTISSLSPVIFVGDGNFQKIS